MLKDVVYRCTICGSPYTEVLAWIDPYEREVVTISKTHTGFCEDCNKEVPIEILNNTDFNKYLSEYEARKTKV